MSRQSFIINEIIILTLLVPSLAACARGETRIITPTADIEPTARISLPAQQPERAATPAAGLFEEAPPALVPMNAADSIMGKEFGGASLPVPAQGYFPPPPSGEPYDDTYYENYGVNPMIDTEDDTLSTFALDVDTGSYSIARRYLMDGNLPEKDSVRVEEFVNYFEQGYPVPTERQTFTIQMDGAPSPFTENEKYQMIRIGIQGYSVEPVERESVSLVFVIDTSGSMEMEGRLELVKKALKLLVNELRPSDRVGIVTYGSEARIALRPTPIREAEEILDTIESLYPEGSTNAAEGLQMGFVMAGEYFNPEGLNRVILCSDGVANDGETEVGAILNMINDHTGNGISLTTVGFGMGNYNDTLLEQLADRGDGFYAYVDNLREAERVFVTNLTSTLQVIASDARVQVDFNPDIVARYRLVGFENRDMADSDFRDDQVDAGEIGAGHSVTALYEIKMIPEVRGRVATAALRWLDPGSDNPEEISRDLYSNQVSETFEQSDPYLQWDIVVAEYAEILRESYWAQDSSLSSVLDEVSRISELLWRDRDVIEFVDMVRLTKRIY